MLALSGSGLPRGPASFSLAELERMPARTITAAIECAGNGRSYFGSVQGTPVSGTQFKLGAIGVARWRGVPLAEVLDRAGLSPHAVSVMLQGLDAEVVANGANQGHVRRPLPIAKALDDALLAYEMNGRELPPDHGAPLRLVVPGWIGVASIKWVGSIDVSRTPQQSFWNTAQ
jgi:DMSO/TMAO reductase YedYZ molybdopterin-dependent catalytic subunit